MASGGEAPARPLQGDLAPALPPRRNLHEPSGERRRGVPNRHDTPKDPWGHPYGYSVGGGEVTLTSYGSDDEPGGSDGAADITRTIKMR